MPRTRGSTPRTRPIRDEAARGMARREHAGKWLAWSEDESRIVAVGDTADDVRRAAELAGNPRFIYDWVPSAESRRTTGLA